MTLKPMKKLNLLILLLLIWTMAPLFWQLYTSFSTEEALLNPLSSVENRWTLDNYLQIINSEPSFWKYLLNSMIVGITSTILTLVVSLPAAYALNKIRKFIAFSMRIMLFGAALFPYVLLFLALLEFARSVSTSAGLINFLSKIT